MIGVPLRKIGGDVHEAGRYQGSRGRRQDRIMPGRRRGEAEERPELAENHDVVTVGETMVLGVPPRPGRLRHATGLELKIGGAESNLAIALSRLGLSAGWASYLGDDEPGQLVLDRVRAEGVDTTRVRRVQDHPTGLYLREQVGTDVRVYYYRQGSAASTMQPKAFDLDYLSGAKFLHLTGITPALSEGLPRFRPVGRQGGWGARQLRRQLPLEAVGDGGGEGVRRGDPARRLPALRRGRGGEGALGPRRRGPGTGAGKQRTRGSGSQEGWGGKPGAGRGRGPGSPFFRGDGGGSCRSRRRLRRRIPGRPRVGPAAEGTPARGERDGRPERRDPRRLRGPARQGRTKGLSRRRRISGKMIQNCEVGMVDCS